MIQLNYLEVVKPVTSIEIGNFTIKSCYANDNKNSCKIAKQALKNNPDDDVIVLDHPSACSSRLTLKDLKELRDGIDALITHLEDR